MADVTGDYLALRREVGAHRSPCDVVRVEGADARTFLQGQLSQDVGALFPGDAAWSLLLEPQGRLVAWLRVWARGDEELLLEVGHGAGAAVLARLQRFLLRVDARLELMEWQRLSLRGPQCPPATDLVDGTSMITAVDWAGLDGLDLVGPEVAVRDVRLVGDEAFESVRIEAGWPATGAEFPVAEEASVIPAEVGQWFIDASVDFDKGCYTGQELVARVDSRGGNTPRHLRGLVIGENVLPPVGAWIVVDGVERGRLTSVGESLDLRAPVALAFVHRSVEPGAEVALRWEGLDEDRAVVAQVRELPLLRAGTPS